jgi:hypothetical protein
MIPVLTWLEMKEKLFASREISETFEKEPSWMEIKGPAILMFVNLFLVMLSLKFAT